jgi:hypothetical protein
MVTAARAIAPATKRATWRVTKRALAMEISIATATGVMGDEEGDGKGGKGDGIGNKEGGGDQWQQHGQWLQ